MCNISFIQVGLLSLSRRTDSDSEAKFITTVIRTGDGIWCGIIFVATGGVGIASTIQSSRRNTIALWIMSFTSAVFSVPQAVTASLGFAYG